MPFQPHADAQARDALDAHHFTAPVNRPVHILLVGAMSIGMLFLAFSGFAQATQAPASSTHRAQSVKHRHAGHSKKHDKAVTPVQPPPPPPLPPAQQPASPAKIDFSHGTLKIDAQNSSLSQILKQISRQTGIQIQGLDQDERIYGQYGPDTVANTLTDLLDGSGYNYVMVGGGEGSPPSKLVLTHGSGEPASGGSINGVSPPQSFTPPNGNGGDPSGQPVMPSAQPTNDPTAGQPKTPQEIFDQLRRAHPQQ
jgi:hypothetical protein